MTPGIAGWILDRAAQCFAAEFEAMTGARPDVSTETLSATPVFSGATFGWAQPFTSLPGEIFFAAAEENVLASGRHALVSGGAEDASEDEQKSAFLKLVEQVFAKLGQALSVRLEREVAPENGGQSVNLPEEACWSAIRLVAGSQQVTYFLAMPLAMDRALADGRSAAEVLPSSIPAPRSNALPAIASNSQTFDLLLDVELPISVSFGQAHVPLKDVLKLTTGSIVELSRTVVEPVDIVINNCVIAKGEVVVVEGNFGVRIQHVVSRTERLRTLQ